MPSSVGIFYFSGTGVTKLISDEIKSKFMNENYNVELFSIEEILKNKNFSIKNDFDLIGFGFPVHALNAPRIFYKFLNILPKTDNKKSFLFKTAGDFFMNGGTTKEIKQLLRKKGYNVAYEELFIVASNLGIRLSNNLYKKLFETSKFQINTMVEDINKGKTKLVKENLIFTIISIVFSSFESIGTKFLKLHFRVKSNCTKCNKCVNLCPQNNISMKNNKITFDWHCIACLRCIYNCPQKSIKLPPFNAFLFDSFDINQILSKKKDNIDNSSKELRFKKYIDKIISSKKD
ncbi:MAG: EFR1 family ferrodoxin [Clostridiales bacterium]